MFEKDEEQGSNLLRFVSLEGSNVQLFKEFKGFKCSKSSMEGFK